MKNLTLKVALVAVATLAGLNGFAQNNGATDWGAAGAQTTGKYNRSATSPITDYTTLTYADSITVGKTMPFFVWPSAAYNPTWNPAGPVPITFYAKPAYPTAAELVTNVISTFAWQIGPTFAGLAPVAGFTKNYVEIALPAAPGNYMIQVTETPLSGTCAGDPVYFGVQTIAAPSAAFAIAALPADATKYGLDSIMYSGCEGTAGLTTAIGTITGDANPFHVNLGFRVYNIAGLDGSGNIVLPGTDITDLGAGFPNRIVKGVDGALTPTAANPIVVPTKATPIVASQTYDVRNAMITVYEFTFHGINGKISRKSDYIAARAGDWTATSYANFTSYDVPTKTTGEKYYIIAFPKPVTGPIYHIANTFAY